MRKAIKRYIIRQLDDPVGLHNPVLKIHIPEPGLQEYFDSEEEAMQAIVEYSNRRYMEYLVIPVISVREVEDS